MVIFSPGSIIEGWLPAVFVSCWWSPWASRFKK